MAVRLRHHHLLCLLTYVGKGYTPAFVANMDRMAARLAAGETVTITDGPDDICRPLLDGDDAEEAPHCLKTSAARRDAHAATALSALLDMPLTAGTELVLDAGRIARLRAAFAAGDIRAACIGCPWHQLCSDVAADGFRQVQLA